MGSDLGYQNLGAAHHVPGITVNYLTGVLAGPGALAAVVTYASTLGRLTTLIATALVLLICAAGFALSGRLFRALGSAIMRLAARIVGLVVFAIATEFVIGGFIASLRGA